MLKLRSYSKVATGLVGLRVHPNPVPELQGVYGRIVERLEPLQDSFYKQVTLEVTLKRLAVLNDTQDVQQIEQRIGDGQIEELIVKAEDELALIPQMEKWQVWNTEIKE